MKKYDAIVIGAGPAGSMAAYTIAKEGMSVLLIDRKPSPGTPKKCAEAIGIKIFELLNLKIEDGWVSNEYDSLLAGFMEGNKILIKTSKTRGYVLNRRIFDYDLAMRSRKEGADHLFGSVVKRVSIEDEVIVSTEKGDFSSKIVIAADGARSIAARQLGLDGLKCHVSMQYEIEGRCDLPHTLQVFFYPEIDISGYCWIFPKKNSINIGLAAKRSAGLKDKLDQFVKAAGFSSRKITDINAGLLPGQNKMSKIYSDRVLVAGDAAGHTNPLTGGGIPAALYDGVLAGGICVKAIRRERFDAQSLSQYQQLWDKSPFGKAWSEGFKLMNNLDSSAYFNNLELIFSKIGPETINGRKGVIKKLLEKGLTFREIMILYKFGSVLFDVIIDYAM